jgi:mycofactocin system glycosyltransferase
MTAVPVRLEGPQHTELPRGFMACLAEGVIRADRGRTLVGGSPAHLLYLLPRAHSLLDERDDVVVTDGCSAALARLLLDRGLAHPALVDDLSGVPGRAEVTVIVPVRDRPYALARLLGALPPEVPTVVVDDGSTDAAATAAVAARAGARLIRHAQPRGPAGARNTGLRAICTPFVAFLDSDVVPRPGWLERLLAHFADPAVGIVAPRIAALETSGGERSGVLARYEAARSSLDLGPSPAVVTPRGRVAYVPSACLVGRVVAFGTGFDETMPVGEDVDLIWRAIGHGWRIRYEPGAIVEHAHRVQIRDWLARKAFYGTGAAPLAQRHRGAVAPVVVTPWTGAVAAALVTQRRWSVPLTAGVTAVATWRLSRKLTRSDHPVRAAAALAPYGLISAVWQTGAALTRHWWPVAGLACVVSRRARRAMLIAAIVDGMLDWRRVQPDLDPVRYVLARRLDDLAYGTGLWWGAWRHRTLAPLLPAVVRSTSCLRRSGEAAGNAATCRFHVSRLWHRSSSGSKQP